MPTNFPQPTFWIVYGDRVLLISYGLLSFIACGLVIWNTVASKSWLLRWMPIVILTTAAALSTPLVIPQWDDAYRAQDWESYSQIALSLTFVYFICGAILLGRYPSDPVMIRLTINNSFDTVSTAKAARHTGILLCALAVLVVFETLPSVRSGSNTMQYCQRNLRHIHESMKEHEKQSPERRLSEAVEGRPRVSWRVAILPYLGSPYALELHQRYHQDAEWDDNVNWEVAQESLPDFRCWLALADPRADSGGRTYTSYAMITGSGTAADNGRVMPLRPEVGANHSAVVIEACGRQIVWTEPRDVDISVESMNFNQPGKTADESLSIGSSKHWKGVNVLMADGSVRCLPLNTDPKVLKALMTSDGAGK